MLKFLGVAVILMLHSLAVVEGDDKCFDMVQELMSGQLGLMVPCINDLSLKVAKERAANYNCIMKCVLTKAGTLSPDGKISVMQAISFILENIPNEYIEKALTEIAKCQKYASLDVGDGSDVGCTKMRPLITCGVDLILNVCK